MGQSPQEAAEASPDLLHGADDQSEVELSSGNQAGAETPSSSTIEDKSEHGTDSQDLPPQMVKQALNLLPEKTEEPKSGNDSAQAMDDMFAGLSFG